MAFVRALQAETLKIKRTLALWLVPVAPLVIVGLQTALVVERPNSYLGQGPGDTWLGYGAQVVLLWCLLMLPLFVTLETALLANLEHGNQQWKHLFALPVPRGAIYAAKQVSGMALIALSMVILYLYIVLSGLLLRSLTPGIGFEAPIPWVPFLEYVGSAYLTSWLIISVHTWIGLCWHSFVVASAVGIGAVVVAVLMVQSDWNNWYPWTLPAVVSQGMKDGLNIARPLVAGAIGGVAAAVVGGWDVIRRDVL
jgi:hypothetical protein